MRASTALLAALALLAAPAAPGAAFSVRGPAEARYDLDLRIERIGVLTGQMSVSVRNTGPGERRRVWLRLWANGEGGCARPRIDVEVTGGGTREPLAVGCTALPVRLAEPLAEGERATIRLHLRVVVPRTARRFGRSGGAVLFGNAIPIVAVERAGGPDLDPYIALGDPFFSLTSAWRARLRVPRGWTAATTGRATRTTRTSDGTHLVVVAPRARDFAIAAGPFRVRRSTASGTRIRYFSTGHRPGRAGRMLRTAERALADFSARYGPYRAPELDVVETPRLASEGMEYPELVMSEPSASTLAHEVAHQWFAAQVGSDGWRAPWLDETLATYVQLRLVGGLERCDLADPFAEYGPARLTWTLGQFDRRPADYPAVYDGGACVLEDLRRRFGTVAIERMLRRYQREHLFGVATADDLVGAIAETAPIGFDLVAFRSYARIGSAGR